jgi:hypothetical protein
VYRVTLTLLFGIDGGLIFLEIFFFLNVKLFLLTFSLMSVKESEFEALSDE